MPRYTYRDPESGKTVERELDYIELPGLLKPLHDGASMTTRYCVQVIEEIAGGCGLGDLVVETDDYATACDFAGAAGPYGGAVIDLTTGLCDVGEGWMSVDEAMDRLSAPEDM